MANSTFLSERSKDLIKKFMLGGALLGGGTMLAADLANWLGSLKKRKEEDDDDTLYIYKDPAQVKSAGVGTGIAIAGGIGSAIGSGLIVHNLYTKFRKNEAQKELDKAQRTFVGARGYKVVDKGKKDKKETKENKEDTDKEQKKDTGEVEKKASSLSLTETLMSGPIALPLLLALGAGVTSYGMLDNAYPIRKPKAKAPKRIEIVEKPSDDQAEYGENSGVDTPVKEASFKAYNEDDAREFLIRLTYMNKAAHSDLADLIGACAAGDANEFAKTASEIGFINALDTVKGGRLRNPDPMSEHLAISFLAKKASIKTQVGMLAAGEFAETFPTMYKAACALDSHTKEALFNITGILGAAVRAERSYDLGMRPSSSMRKEAKFGMVTSMLAGSELSDLLGNALERKHDDTDDDETATEGDSNESTGTSGQEAGLHNPGSPSRKPAHQIIASSKSARKMLDKIPPDMIDKILQPSK